MKIFFVIILGLVLGSFANLCIYRIPNTISIVFPRSYCESCKRSIKPYDLLPIASYLLLKGRCRFCKAHIDKRNIRVEIMTLIMSLIIYAKYSIGFKYFILLTITLILIIITFIDIEHLIIPDSLVITILFLSTVRIIYKEVFISSEKYIYFKEALVGLIFGMGIYVIIYIFSNKSVGHGDIKLFSALSTIMGLKNSVNSFILSYIIGAFASIVLIIKYDKSLNYKVPFAPFIALSFIIVEILELSCLNFEL